MYTKNLHFHFTGIGGSGMSGIAEILLSTGFKVSGTDVKFSSVCSRLVEQGASISIGHEEGSLPESADLLVYSSAIDFSNPEIVEAKRRNIPVIRRAEVLAELMRLKFGIAIAGSHGKTTTTSLTAAILEEAELDPTVIIGGIVQAHGTGARHGQGDFLVAESDESDRSFLLLRPSLAIVTNIDSEHLNAYSSLKELEESFESFLNSVPFYGLAVMCIDDQRVRDISQRYTKRKITYGLSLDADLRAEFISQEHSQTNYKVFYRDEFYAQITLPMPGKHLMLNSLAAIAIAIELGVDKEVVVRALEKFKGVSRRSEVIAKIADITVIDDYGHHPTEIQATLKAIRAGWEKGLNKLHVVFQPHRYSRTQSCFADFAEAFQAADRVYITDVYSAGEAEIPGVNSEKLASIISNPEVVYIDNLELIEKALLKQVEPGDVVVFQGAGTISQHARSFAKKLSEELKVLNLTSGSSQEFAA